VACHRTCAVQPEPRYHVSRNRLAPAIQLSLNFHTALQNVRFRKEAIYTLAISGATPLPLSISLLSCYTLIGHRACHISILFMVFLCLAVFISMPRCMHAHPPAVCHQLCHYSHLGPNKPPTFQEPDRSLPFRARKCPFPIQCTQAPVPKEDMHLMEQRKFFIPRSMLVPAHVQLVMPATQPRLASTSPHPHTPTEADQEQKCQKHAATHDAYVRSLSVTNRLRMASRRALVKLNSPFFSYLFVYCTDSLLLNLSNLHSGQYQYSKCVSSGTDQANLYTGIQYWMGHLPMANFAFGAGGHFGYQPSNCTISQAYEHPKLKHQ